MDACMPLRAARGHRPAPGRDSSLTPGPGRLGRLTRTRPAHARQSAESLRTPTRPAGAGPRTDSDPAGPYQSHIRVTRGRGTDSDGGRRHPSRTCVAARVRPNLLSHVVPNIGSPRAIHRWKANCQGFHLSHTLAKSGANKRPACTCTVHRRRPRYIQLEPRPSQECPDRGPGG